MKNNSNDIWFIKHKPLKFTELHFSSDVHFEVLNWIKNWKVNSILNIHGQHGCGKSVLINAAAISLKYYPINYDPLEILELKKYIKNSTKTINKKKHLLIIEEEYITPKFIFSVKYSKIPIIFITTNIPIKYNNALVLRIPKPKYEDIIHIVGSILKKESKFGISNQKLLEIIYNCNSDIRSIINHVQLFIQGNKSIKYSKKNELVEKNIFTICKDLFKSKIPFRNLKENYSEKVCEMSFNYLLENCTDLEAINNILQSISDTEFLSYDAHFIQMIQLNKCRGDYKFTKSNNINFLLKNKTRNKNGNGNIFIGNKLEYLPLLKRDLNNPRICDHLIEIFKKYNLKNLSEIDEATVNQSKIKSINPEKKLKYRFNNGSLSGVKRDLSYDTFIKKLKR